MIHKKFANDQIANLLREISAAYEIKNESPFRIRAYRRAADAIEHATSEVKDLWEEGQLQEIPGVGEGIAGYLDEYFRTGQVKHFGDVRKDLPEGMFVLLPLPGLGPKNAYRLAKELKLETLADLYRAIKENRVAALAGFGEDSQRAIRRSIEEERPKKSRLLLWRADLIVGEIIKYLEKHPAVERVDPLGSLRRRVATIGDLDLAVATSRPEEVLDHIAKYPPVARELSRGKVKASLLLRGGQRVDVMTQKPAAYGALLQHFTGSKHHNIALRKKAQQVGLSLSEYGIKTTSGKMVEFADEASFYRYFKLAFIPPELREDAGEIAAAGEGAIPELVELTDIKGDLQSHTTDSDGEHRHEEMARAACALGYEYFGITDHSPSLRTKSEREILDYIKRTKSKIDKINSSFKGQKVLLGTECNILADLTLSLTDKILAEFDYVVAAIHTAFNQDRQRMTRRLLVAIENPWVSFIAHPTGRLLGKREGYEVDWDQVFAACLQHGKALEINAFPTRLDLPDTLAREAVSVGVKLVVNTDAHNLDQLKFMSYGVDVARRAWCTRGDILNTLSFPDLCAKLRIRNH